MKYYTGIGSRETPKYILDIMTKIAYCLEQKGYVLRSGHANGADSAFEIGCKNAEIFIPWRGFNNADYNFGICEWTEEEKNIAKKSVIEVMGIQHWNNLSNGGKSLHLRNYRQIFGEHINSTPSEFVLCWTNGGKIIGGTATAIKLALKNFIPVFNLANENTLKKIVKGLNIK